MSRSAAAAWIGRLTGLAVRDARVAGAQHGYQHLMITLADGRRAFAKAIPPGAVDHLTAADRAETTETSVRSDAAAAAFAAEANGLRWLAEAAAVAVPDVLAVGPQALVISMIPPGPPRPRRPSGSAPTWPGCTRPARPVSAHRGRASSPACRWTTRRCRMPRGSGRSGTHNAGCCRSCAGPWPPVRWAPRTRGWWRRSSTGSPRWPGRPAAEPDPRRLLGGERAVVRRARLAHRPGRPWRAP